MGVKRVHGIITTLEGDEVFSDDTESEGEEGQFLEGDFEFDNGGVNNGIMGIDDDGWGFKGFEGTKESASVDLDGIIARHRKKSRKEENSEEEESGEEEDEEEEIDDEDESENVSGESVEDLNEAEAEEWDGFGDDDLAEDGFGMGANEDEDHGSAQNSDEDNEEEENEETRVDYDEDDGASDTDSVATPKPHPDDLASSSDSENESEDDPEEKDRKAAYFEAPEESAPSTSETIGFENMFLTRPMLKALAKMKFRDPTQIQARTIPLALKGKDIVASAVTGSGKTAAFMIPILERLSYRSREIARTRVLVLTPTRELAVQVYQVATQLAHFTDVKFCLCVGGLSLKAQEAELRKAPDVVIATPGRFIDHVRNSQGFVPDCIEILVIDEADRMLEDGFRDELTEITESLPKKRQTMLFSATMTDDVNSLIRLSLTKPVRLFVDPKNSVVGGLTQEFIRVKPQREPFRPAMLIELCRSYFTSRVIIFFKSKAFVHRMRIIFGLLNLKAAELHGSLTQVQRMESLESFRTHRVDFLLCTDLASRGLDIKGIDTVINYEAPSSYEVYLHRVGRTARAGRQGRAITLAGEGDRKLLKKARKSMKKEGELVSRVLDVAKIDSIAKELEDLEDEITEILKEEDEERQMRIAEMEVRKGENVIKHQDEIMSRPKRDWFQTKKEKAVAKEKSKQATNGLPVATKNKKTKRKYEDNEPVGRLYKKTKTERGSKLPKKEKTKGKKKGALSSSKGKRKAKSKR